MSNNTHMRPSSAVKKAAAVALVAAVAGSASAAPVAGSALSSSRGNQSNPNYSLGVVDRKSSSSSSGGRSSSSSSGGRSSSSKSGGNIFKTGGSKQSSAKSKPINGIKPPKSKNGQELSDELVVFIEDRVKKTNNNKLTCPLSAQQKEALKTDIANFIIEQQRKTGKKFTADEITEAINFAQVKVCDKEKFSAGSIIEITTMALTSAAIVGAIIAIVARGIIS
jgi:hypothetical protein